MFFFSFFLFLLVFHTFDVKSVHDRLHEFFFPPPPPSFFVSSSLSIYLKRVMTAVVFHYSQFLFLFFFDFGLLVNVLSFYAKEKRASYVE